MRASCRGCTEVVRILLENGAEVDAADRFRLTALVEASRCGHARIAQHGAGINEEGRAMTRYP